ncbi:MAG: Gfo/Idh/MocA family oxidoreductase [Rhodocyclaceae bacterium]
MKTIRWGIIGCGDVTEVKSGPGFQKAEHSSLVAVMRRNGALAADYAQRHGVPRWYDNAEALIADPEVNAVYVATPPAPHKDYTLMCAAVGKPVYVEKPMAMNHAECVDMVNACRRAGVPLFVAYYRRALARFVKIKELIDGGAIGTPRFVNVVYHRPASESDRDPAQNWRIDPAIAGGGYFLDLASHMLDFLDHALGPIAQASGQGGNQAGLYKAEDIVTGSFVFESGVQGSGVWCFDSFGRRDETTIVGTHGSLRYATFDDSPVVLTTEAGTEEFVIPYPAHVHQPLIQTIVDQLNGQGLCPSTGESAARTSGVMDQLLGDYYR